MSMFQNMPGSGNPIADVMSKLQGGLKKGRSKAAKKQDYVIKLENQAKMHGYQSELRKDEATHKSGLNVNELKVKGSETRKTAKSASKNSMKETTHGTSEAIRFHGATGAGSPTGMKTSGYQATFAAPQKPETIVNSNAGSAGQTVPTRTPAQTAGAVTVSGKASTTKKTTTTPKQKTTKPTKAGKNAGGPTTPAVNLENL